ncbi:MAG: polymer-forming cytoskeletal protein [Rhodobacteraceae bacterium]|nr:polymer-forming cytoskeletal protein [Paracoccaceae bacterium]
MQDVIPPQRKPVSSAPQTRQSSASPPSQISKDLQIKGNLNTSNDIVIQGKVEGDIRARVLTVGETADLVGHIRADEVILNGRVAGEVRGKKVRLNKTAKVEGDIIHSTISIEAGAYFEGSVQRAEDPIGSRQQPSTGVAQKPRSPGKPGVRPTVAPKRQS